MLGWTGLLRFESPGYLSLLALLPLLVVFSFRSLAGLGGGRRVVAIIMRVVVVACMIFSLAGMQRTRTNEAVCTIFLVDRSNSIPHEYQRQAFEFIQEAAAARQPDDLIGVVAFDGRSAVEQLPMGALAIDRLSDPVDPDRTDLAGALRLGMALFPPNFSRRIVLISDGNENVGNGLTEAEHYASAGVPIDIVPILYEHLNEVVFEQLRAPPTATAEETINLQMVLRSQKPMTGQIKLEHNGQLVDLAPGRPDVGFPVQLDAGANRFEVPVPLRAAGAHRFRAIFEPDDPRMDAVVANNEGQAFTVVAGQGKVLILTTQQDLGLGAPAAPLLQRALESEKLVCDLEVAGANPLDQVRLLEYSAVILSNVPAGDLSETEHQVLAVYVRDLGGGLIMIGGDNGFGAGGWLGSPVEDVLPVRCDVKNIKQIPKGALVLCMHACEVPQGNYLGQRCAINAVKTLSGRDLVGVLSWEYQGAQQGFWVVPLQPVGDKTAIIQKIQQMQMGDMPDLDEVMRPGVEALLQRPDAATKHMIIVSDFDPQPPADDLIATMKKSGITCSTIAIGYGGHWINEGLAGWIADSTGGRFYRTNDYSKLPQIFIKESQMVQRSLIVEQPFQPRLVPTVARTVAGLAPGEIPQLDGLVITTPKELAEVPMVRPTDAGTDPVLAHWSVGLGKTVAFTSGMWSRWGRDWVSWVQFSKFWAQIVRWASRQLEPAELDVTTVVRGGRGRIRIDALDKNADVIDFMQVRGVLISPGQEALPIELTQTGPGRYEGEFDARERGSYILNLKYEMGGEGGRPRSGTLRTGVAVAYSPEYRELQPNLALLEELRARTGGRRLDRTQAVAAFDRASLLKAQTRASVWEDLTRWMLVLFLMDVAVRRIAFRPRELARKAREYMVDVGRGRATEEAAAVLDTLKGARQRLREATPEAPAVDAAARYEAQRAVDKAGEDLARALGGATQQEAPVVARPTGKKPPTSETEYTSRLLKAKRRAREQTRGEEPPDQPT